MSEDNTATVHQIFSGSASKFKQVFTTEEPLTVTDCEVGGKVTCSNEPFAHCMVKDFLQNQSDVDTLQQTLLKLQYKPKNNDLYKFKQTKALENRKEPAIKSMRRALVKVRDWLSELLEVELTDKIDMFSAQYNYTDTLLCHDDELEGRRVAYIYYLVPDGWSEQDGGALDLYTSRDGVPGEIVKSITPVRNCLLFFEVTHKSFHQVAEVLSESKCRLSVTGWFHGPPAPRPSPSVTSSSVARLPPVDISEEMFYKFQSSEFTDMSTVTEIRATFEEQSEIQLNEFIKPDVFEVLCKDVKMEDVKWVKVGPANKRNIEVADVTSLSQTLQDCLKFLTSDAMLLTLSNMTGLGLHPLADTEEEPEAKKAKVTAGISESAGSCGTVSCQLRRWSHGAYTLLHDADIEQDGHCALDAFLHFNCTEWEEEQGGYTSYVANGENEELLTVEPRDNCLSLVYRDKGALCFVKHVNHRVTDNEHPYFYDISLVYHEP